MKIEMVEIEDPTTSIEGVQFNRVLDRDSAVSEQDVLNIIDIINLLEDDDEEEGQMVGGGSQEASQEDSEHHLGRAGHLDHHRYKQGSGGDA